MVPANQPVYVNGIPLDPWEDYGGRSVIFLVKGHEQSRAKDGSPLDSKPAPEVVEKISAEQEEAEWDNEEDLDDPKKRKNFMSRDLLEAFKKYAKDPDNSSGKAEMEEKIKQWEQEVKGGGGKGGAKGGEGSTEGSEGSSEGASTEGGGEGGSSSEASSEEPSSEASE